jgi:hypothetical protein
VITVGDKRSRKALPSRAVMPSLQARFVASAALDDQHSVLVASSGCAVVAGTKTAGGAETIVVAENIGSGTARDEGTGRPVFWQDRVLGGTYQLGGISRQSRVNLGNTAAARYEGKAMHEDKPTRECRGGQYQGRVAGTPVVSSSSVSSVRRTSVRRIGEPALGVMGGLLQPVSSPAEPPVSSLSGPTVALSTTAPAPIRDVLAGEVSPLAFAAEVSVDVAPLWPPGHGGPASGQGRKR